MSTLDDPTPSDTHPAPRRSKRTPPAGLFRAFWRWHFYAAIIVIPVLLVFAITGLIYLFRFQIEPALHPDLMRVDPAAHQEVVPYEAQREAVAEAHPEDVIVSMTEPGAPDESTRFTLTTSTDSTRDVFVDPYRGEVLGDLDPDSTVSGTAIRLHADLMAGRTGDLVMELGACWSVVMAITGYYLFFKGRRARRRQRDKRARGARLRWSHGGIGSVVGVGLLLLVVSGLPWTGVWGEQVQRLVTAGGSSFWSEDHGALSNPTSTLDESLPHSHHTVPWAQEKSPVPGSDEAAGDEVSVADVDTAIAVGADEGLERPMTVALPSDDQGVFSAIGYAFEDPAEERTVHVDQYGGQVASTYGYDDYPGLAKVVAQGIAVHEGRRFGMLSMVLTTAFCLAVIASCLTGPVMWWRRRPRGAGAVLGAPRGRMPIASSPALAVSPDSAARLPDDERLAGVPRTGPLAVTKGDDVPLRADGEEAPALAELLTGVVELLAQLGYPAPQRVHLVLELEDPLDPPERDALLLGEPLHLPQPRDVGGAVSAPPTARARGDDQTDPVVLTQGLGVHAGELGRHGDDEDRRLVVRAQPGDPDHRAHSLRPSAVSRDLRRSRRRPGSRAGRRRGRHAAPRPPPALRR